ncbi:hypothetical protein ACQV5M_19235 [Leptospira sp. SA-E8]|uniref:hypothetical protein n=1 Tax=Leptospira sp. SA-E8 TaxID=3422259 RepID=UPI003EBD0957
MDAQVLAAGYVEALAAAWAWVSSLYLEVVRWKWFVPATMVSVLGVVAVVTLCQIIYFRLRGWKLWLQPGGHVVLDKGNGDWRYFYVKRNFEPSTDDRRRDSDWISDDFVKPLGMRNLGL